MFVFVRIGISAATDYGAKHEVGLTISPEKLLYYDAAKEGTAAGTGWFDFFAATVLIAHAKRATLHRGR